MSDNDCRCTVRVWFGKHVMCEHTAPTNEATRYADAMRRRFAGLRVTTDPAAADRKIAPPLPTDHRLWGLTVHARGESA